MEKKHDCMVGLSGGRESSYTALKLAQDYNMKVLCIHYDNPFTSAQAKENMEQIADRLQIDIYKRSFKDGEHFNATRKALKVWSHHPSSPLIPIVCAHCKNWRPTIFKRARERLQTEDYIPEELANDVLKPMDQRIADLNLEPIEP